MICYRVYCMMMANPAPSSIPSPLLHFNLDSLYRMRFNFRRVKLSWIMSFCDFHVFILCGWWILRCSLCFLPASATDEEKASLIWDIPPFGEQKWMNGHSQVKTNKRFLSSTRIQLSVASMKIHRLYGNKQLYLFSMVLIHQGYRASATIFAMCDIIANQPV